MGKLADLCLWRPSMFGVKPDMVIKGGTIAWAMMGDPNASILRPSRKGRGMFGSFGKAVGPTSLALYRAQQPTTASRSV